MNNTEKSSVVIKSNVTLKSRGVIPPIDNMPIEYFDVRLNNLLTKEQEILKTKMMFWANNIVDENGNKVEDECYKGCENCGEANNPCKRPQNKAHLLLAIQQPPTTGVL